MYGPKSVCWVLSIRYIYWPLGAFIAEKRLEKVSVPIQCYCNTTLLMNIKKAFLANVQMMRKHQVKLKETWIAEIEGQLFLFKVKINDERDGFPAI